MVSSSKSKKIFDSNLMSEVTSSEVLNVAYKHVFNKRKTHHHNSDVWHASHNWLEIEQDIREKLLNGSYNIEPVKIVTSATGETYGYWSTVDAIVLKALSMVLQDRLIDLGVNNDVYHLAGLGGLKGAVRNVAANVRNYKYLVKSDVASFYKTINHEVLMNECSKYITDKRILRIIEQYANHLEDVQGEYRLITEGISRGCSLSPIMGAIILKSLDYAIGSQYWYARYMDDWVILTNTRNKLRSIVKAMHEIMYRLKLRLAPDKTYIGKISKGFDFLGYRFDRSGIIGLAKKTILNFINKVTELYEQNASNQRIGYYIKNWSVWARSGVVLTSSLFIDVNACIIMKHQAEYCVLKTQ